MSALISSDGVYRYWLRRDFPPRLDAPESRTCVFIMLNPSTADAEVNDPTIRRCIGFAYRVKATSLLVVNLFAYRATDPRDLLVAYFSTDIVGPENDNHVHAAVREANGVIVAWGANAPVSRVQELLSVIGTDDLWCLGVNADGSPKHPLYVPNAADIKPWTPNV